MDTKRLASAIKVKLKAGGISAATAAQSIGVSHSTFCRMKNGKRARFRNYTVVCEWLGLPFENFNEAVSGSGDTLKDIENAINNDLELKEIEKQALIELMRVAYNKLSNKD